MADKPAATSIEFAAGAGSVTMTINTGEGSMSLSMPVSASARLGRLMLHHASEAAALGDGPTRTDEQRVHASPVTVSQLGVSPMGDPVLVCRDAEGLTFHLALDRASAQSLSRLISDWLRDDPTQPTRQ